MSQPRFSGITDPQVASACNEMFVPDVCTFWGMNAEHPEGAGFPPVPAYITNIMAAYIETAHFGQPSGVRRQLAQLDEDHQPTSGELIDIYDTCVGYVQKNFLPGLLKVTELVPGLEDRDGLQDWCIEQTASNRHKLLAAFVLAREIKSNTLIGAIAYPKVIMHQLPLLVREGIIGVLPHVRNLVEVPGFIPESVAADINYFVDGTLSNNPRNRTMAAAAVASFLPSTEELRTAF